MIKLKNYQENYMEDKNFITIGDFSRGLGKTFLLAYIVLEKRPKNVLYMNGLLPLGKSVENIVNKIKEINSCLNLEVKKDFIKITYPNSYTVINVYVRNIYNREDIRQDYDMLLFDDMLPIESLISEKTKKIYSTMTCKPEILSRIYRSMYSYNIKVYGANYCKKEFIKKIRNDIDESTFKEEFDITNIYNDKEKYTDKDLLSQTISNTIKKLNELSLYKNSTMTQKDLIIILKGLIDIKKSQY